MDEYDVFLDEVSRGLTLLQLQDFALTPSQRSRQFIIVTPNNLSSVKTTDVVRIKRMQPPLRAASGGLQQTTL